MSKKTKDPWVRIIDVSEPVLHKKGYTLYKVTSKVFPKNSVEAVTEVTVWKRYNDFKKLHKALSTLHQNLYLKDTFPPFAKTRIFGRFQPDVIEERRQSAHQLLQFAANCSPLFTSQVFVKFFEDGYCVENPNANIFIDEDKLDKVLQPQPPTKINEHFDHTLAESNEGINTSLNNGLKEPITPLGGIWQHHQVPDNISVSSQCTDDDDRTTFTDDESNTSRPSLNLSEFDPLLQRTKTDSASKSGAVQQEMCNSWLLSALQSCSGVEGERDLENIMEFPTPFGDFEVLEEPVMEPYVEQVDTTDNGDKEENCFSFDFPAPVAQEALETTDFDPLEIKTDDPFEDDSYNCDRFAMTPNSDKKSPTKRPSFVVLASKYVSSAQESEGLGHYKEAFDSYKKAIDVLLQGCQNDNNSEIQDSIKKKVLLYLMRAEELYETKLPKLDSKEDMPSVLPNLSLSSSKKSITIRGNAQDLNKYKVLGVLDKVLLVLDVSTNSTFIVKTLYKSPNSQVPSSDPTLSQTIPFVVRLHQVYETNYALFLILEHATGGRLWDYVSSFLQRSPLSPCNDGTCLYVESKTKVELCNVYSGKKVQEISSEPEVAVDVSNIEERMANLKNSNDSDLTPSENCPTSYIALFKKYADTSQKDENVSLAKYKKLNASFSDRTRLSEFNKSDEIQSDIPKKLNLLPPPISGKTRLSSSTGSLETTFSQKACNLDALNAMDEVVENMTAFKSHLPESCVKMWAAEIVLALEALHHLGIIWRDFNPHNILLGEEGHILLTYQRKWKNVDFFVDEVAKRNLFCAPEIGSIYPITPDCDWWSLGAILFELLTGQSLKSCHPTGITRHTVLNFPTDVSSDAKDFIVKLLQYNPTERLGSGIYGVEEIKSHPFFRDIDWRSLYR
ncbi:hypothetical protein JTE90_028183 [Oedothorax gibbosus]|uniref:Ribosomal protein S6 kinase delta-1 n=1 Tax=Oedothorax gibbosus TaxID=931172 RepID=A0AAV6UEB5_9ARAC|nr:hypothetical protein JTE90_028183 [Oedothorax gibbosus]